MQTHLQIPNPPFSTQIMSWHEDALMAHRKKLYEAIENIKQQQAKNQASTPQMIPVYEGGIMLIDDELIRRSIECLSVAYCLKASPHGKSNILKNHLEKTAHAVSN